MLVIKAKSLISNLPWKVQPIKKSNYNYNSLLIVIRQHRAGDSL